MNEAWALETVVPLRLHFCCYMMFLSFLIMWFNNTEWESFLLSGESSRKVRAHLPHSIHPGTCVYQLVYFILSFVVTVIHFFPVSNKLMLPLSFIVIAWIVYVAQCVCEILRVVWKSYYCYCWRFKSHYFLFSNYNSLCFSKRN